VVLGVLFRYWGLCSCPGVSDGILRDLLGFWGLCWGPGASVRVLGALM